MLTTQDLFKYSRLSIMSVLSVRATASLTLGTGSHDRSRRWGSTSRANILSDSTRSLTNWLHSRANVWRRFQRELCANCSANSASRPRSNATSADTWSTNSVTCKIELSFIQNFLLARYNKINLYTRFKKCFMLNLIIWNVEWQTCNLSWYKTTFNALGISRIFVALNM